MNRIATVLQGIFLWVFFIFTINLSSQTPFFTEDFANDIPSGWTKSNIGGNPAIMWTWCPSHLPGPNPMAGCPLVFNDIINKQEAFNATTVDNGFAVFDSDFYGFNGFDHNSFLSTPAIDCSGQQEVWLKFEMHIGVFNFPTADNAVIEVSEDKTNWTTFNLLDLATATEIDPGIATWSLNPHYAILDLTAVAGSKPEIYIRWRWRGDFEFYWAIDDIVLYDSDPSALFLPPHELRLTNFFAIAPNVTTPLSQVERFGFLADIKSDGLETQTNVNLSVKIKDAMTQQEVYEENFGVEDILPGELKENVALPGAGFLPDAIGFYEGMYTVSGAGEDTVLENNSRPFSFEVSDLLFAKEDGILSHTAPFGVFEDGANLSWGWGNYFFCPRGLGFKAASIDFNIQGALTAFASMNQVLRVSLYQWRDNNKDLDAQEKERFLLGTSNYAITGFEKEDEFISVALNNGEGIPLDDDGEYIAMLEFDALNTQDELTIAFNNNFNYGGMYLRSDQDMQPRHTSFLWIGNPDSTNFIANGFGFDIVPCIRLNLDLMDALPPTLPLTDRLSLHPNPVGKELRVSVDLGEVSNWATFSIFSSDGQLMELREVKNLQRDNLSFDVNHLGNGLYFLQLKTERGIKTERFIVSRF